MSKKKGHECPYRGYIILHYKAEAVWYCGEHGALCDMCKEDRADRRDKFCRDCAADALAGEGDGEAT